MTMSGIFQPDLSPEALEELFHSDEKCLEFLAGIKWADGFTCKKCGNTNYCAGQEPFSRRCTKCKSKETAINGTIFHGIKFPVSKAFYIAYQVCKGNEDISTYEFGRRLSLRQMTCWNFKSRIQHALQEMGTLSEKERNSIEKILTS
jgi:two-component system, sensor histidine kinase LadS